MVRKTSQSSFRIFKLPEVFFVATRAICLVNSGAAITAASANFLAMFIGLERVSACLVGTTGTFGDLASTDAARDETVGTTGVVGAAKAAELLATPARRIAEVFAETDFLSFAKAALTREVTDFPIELSLLRVDCIQEKRLHLVEEFVFSIPEKITK